MSKQHIYEHPITGRICVETINTEPSMTQQQFKDECDINNIIKRYNETGEFLSKTSKQGQFADFSQIQDYQSMLTQVIHADEAFSSLPATTRLRFNNDPASLINFLQNEKNYDEGVKLGLISPKQNIPNYQEEILNELKKTNTQPKSTNKSTQQTSNE